MSTRPVPTIGFRRERRQNGEQHLVAVIVEDITLPKDSRLLLRRLHDGGGPGPEFALLCIPAPSLTKGERKAARADRLDGSALRTDPCEAGGPPAPFGETTEATP